MFTSEPTLSQRIERMISATPVIDPYSHVPSDPGGAENHAPILANHEMLAALRAAGMPDDVGRAEAPLEETVRQILPYLRRIRNTATAWCFYRILRDLYDFQDPHLTDSNYRELLDVVERRGREPGWPQAVLHERSRLQTVVTGAPGGPGDNGKGIEHRLDLHPLAAPGSFADDANLLSPERPPHPLDLGTGSTPAQPVATAEALRRSVLDALERTVNGAERFASISCPAGLRLDGPPDDAAADRVLARLRSAESLTEGQVHSVAQVVAWTAFAWHHEHRRTLQVVVGADAAPAGVELPPPAESGWIRDLARTFARFPNARFDLVVGSEPLAHETALLARRMPNVSVSGYGGPAFSLPSIERIAAGRVQQVPMSKITGFTSHACSVEWVYGKFQLVRKATASALARLVEAGIYEEDEIPPIVGQIFHDTPRALYGLDGG
jgi:glucuronate isomerase